jgi:biotin transporter BioY
MLQVILFYFIWNFFSENLNIIKQKKEWINMIILINYICIYTLGIIYLNCIIYAKIFMMNNLH